MAHEITRWHRPVATLLLCLFGVSALGKSLDQAFYSLQNAISEVADKSRQTPAALPPAAISNIRAHINALQTGSAQLPLNDQPLYAMSLLHDATLMRQVVHEGDTAKAASILADVEADLKIKAAARSGMGMASRFNGMVSVAVTTRRADRAVSGYTIIANPVHYKNSAPFARFEKLSSPATGSVPPGRYEMIAVLNGTPVRKEIVTIGLAAQDTVAIDFQVP